MILVWKQLSLWCLPNGHLLILSLPVHLLVSILLSERAFTFPLFLYLFSLFSVDSWFLILFCMFINPLLLSFILILRLARYGQLEPFKLDPFDTSSSFFEHTFTFWHSKVIPAHRLLFKLESTISPRNSSFFWWKMVFKNQDLVLGMVIATGVSWLLGPRQRVRKCVFMHMIYIHIHIPTYISYPFVYLPTY